MESSPYGFLVNPSLPSNGEIVALCKKHMKEQRVIITDPSAGSVVAFVKFSVHLTVEQARTQDWVAKTLRDSGSDVQAPRVYHAFMQDYFGYIAMEYIEGEDCKCSKTDIELGAKAVKALISLQAPPGATLGHLGGGIKSVVHSFYPEWYCDANYRSDQDFFDHMRNMCNRFYNHTKFRGDMSGYDRFLCPSDLHHSNFRKRKTEDGRIVIVALDFTATCFMPLPFVQLALEKAWHPFGQLVVKKLAPTFPPLSELDYKVLSAINSVSARIIPYGRTIDLPRGVTYRIPGYPMSETYLC